MKIVSPNFRLAFLFFAAALLLTTLPFVVAAQTKADEKVEDSADVIKVETNLVVLNAVVADAAGKPAANLRAADFEVFEDGKLQTVEIFGAESTPFAAVVLIDTSGSMSARLAVARSAAIRFLDGLRADDAAAVYNFDSKTNLIQDFSQSRDLPFAAYDLKADGMTVLNDAILAAAQVLSERPEKRRAIIVLSDGADTKSRASADKALRAALRANATLYTVDMSAFESENSRERMQSAGALKNFAEKSGGRFVAVTGAAVMRDAFRQIVEELGVQYTIGYEPSNTARDGKWRRVEVKLRARPSLQVRARKGYYAPQK